MKEAREQVMKAQRAITDATGVAPRYFRPPYGALNPEVMAEIGLPIVLWSIDTNDWRVPGVDALVERVSVAGPGDIILFHDVHTSTVDAMPRVIGELQDRGLQLVTLDDLRRPTHGGAHLARIARRTGSRNSVLNWGNARAGSDDLNSRERLWQD